MLFQTLPSLSPIVRLSLTHFNLPKLLNSYQPSIRVFTAFEYENLEPCCVNIVLDNYKCLWFILEMNFGCINSYLLVEGFNTISNRSVVFSSLAFSN